MGDGKGRECMVILRGKVDGRELHGTRKRGSGCKVMVGAGHWRWAPARSKGKEREVQVR